MAARQWWENVPSLAYTENHHGRCPVDDVTTTWRCGICNRFTCYFDMSNHLEVVHKEYPPED